MKTEITDLPDAWELAAAENNRDPGLEGKADPDLAAPAEPHHNRILRIPQQQIFAKNAPGLDPANDRRTTASCLGTIAIFRRNKSYRTGPHTVFFGQIPVPDKCFRIHIEIAVYAHPVAAAKRIHLPLKLAPEKTPV